MPLPFSLDHINLWLLRDEIDGQAGWTIVDCGIASDAIRTHWEQIFDTHLDGLPVLRVLVTHCHPDHFGLANWLCEGGDKGRWNVRLWMTLGEYMFGCLMAAGNGSNAGGAAAADHFARHGPPIRPRSTSCATAATTTRISCRPCRRAIGACAKVTR